jgi:hypothetical protein
MIFLKNRKNVFADSLCQGLSAQDFFKKIEKNVFVDDLCQGLSAQDFLKNRKTVYADGLCQGLSAQNFSKKEIKPPSLPTARHRGRRQRRFQKPST